MIERGDPTTTFERSETEPDGHVLVHKQGTGVPNSPYAGKYAAVVARPKLEVTCSSYELATRTDADAVVALCQTLKR